MKRQTKKEKAWYDLLEKYNCLIEEKGYKPDPYDKERLEEVKGKILHSLCEDFYVKGKSDVIDLNKYLSQGGFRAEYRVDVFENSWISGWAKRADNIIASVNEERTITKEDMEDSYYGLRFFNGQVNAWQFGVILAGVMVVVSVLYVVLK